MREVAQLLTGWADDMESSLEAGKKKKTAAAETAVPETVPTDEPAAVPSVESDKPAADQAEPAAVPEQPAVDLSYEGVRGVLSAKCAAGFKAQVQAVINAFGAAKFSEVAPEHYLALLEMVSELGGDADAG